MGFSKRDRKKLIEKEAKDFQRKVRADLIQQFKQIGEKDYSEFAYFSFQRSLEKILEYIKYDDNNLIKKKANWINFWKQGKLNDAGKFELFKLVKGHFEGYRGIIYFLEQEIGKKFLYLDILKGFNNKIHKRYEKIYEILDDVNDLLFEIYDVFFQEYIILGHGRLDSVAMDNLKEMYLYEKEKNDVINLDVVSKNRFNKDDFLSVYNSENRLIKNVIVRIPEKINELDAELDSIINEYNLNGFKRIKDIRKTIDWGKHVTKGRMAKFGLVLLIVGAIGVSALMLKDVSFKSTPKEIPQEQVIPKKKLNIKYSTPKNQYYKATSKIKIRKEIWGEDTNLRLAKGNPVRIKQIGQVDNSIWFQTDQGWFCSQLDDNIFVEIDSMGFFKDYQIFFAEHIKKYQSASIDSDVSKIASAYNTSSRIEQQIKDSAKRNNIPYKLSRRFAWKESGIRQFKSNGKPMEGYKAYGIYQEQRNAVEEMLRVAFSGRKQKVIQKNPFIIKQLRALFGDNYSANFEHLYNNYNVYDSRMGGVKENIRAIKGKKIKDDKNKKKKIEHRAKVLKAEKQRYAGYQRIRDSAYKDLNVAIDFFMQQIKYNPIFNAEIGNIYINFLCSEAANGRPEIRALDLMMALSGYNNGRGNTKKAYGIPKNQETIEYVQKIGNYFLEDYGLYIVGWKETQYNIVNRKKILTEQEYFKLNSQYASGKKLLQANSILVTKGGAKVDQTLFRIF